MDERKIIIINLSKGKVGDENMKLLGGLLVTKIYLAAMSRADMPDRVVKTLPNFYLFVDEFQNFANASFADILSEARKYKLNLTIAHQYVEQMDEMSGRRFRQRGYDDSFPRGCHRRGSSGKGIRSDIHVEGSSISVLPRYISS